jgi:putative component of membrane protein insertase Oxa1/YidC/SpoIIIJ protein YidD
LDRDTFLICKKCGCIKQETFRATYSEHIMPCCGNYDYNIVSAYGETVEQGLIRWVRCHYFPDGRYNYNLNNRLLSVKKAKLILISKMI